MVKRKSTPRRKVVRKTKRSKASGSKKTTKTVNRSVMKTGSNAAHHAVRVQPFSGATSQPKIPDGLFTSSLSRRLQNVTEIVNDNGSMGATEMWIVFAPTLGVPLCVMNSADGKAKRGTSAFDPQFIGFPNQSVQLQNFTPGTNTPVWPALAATAYEITNYSGFAQWRVVSQGLRMELVNTDDENDGWFEAFRFNWRAAAKDLLLTPLDGGTTANPIGCAPNPNTLHPYISTLAPVEQPGYATGLLKDLKKYDFKLHPQSTTHDPVTIKERTGYTAGTELNISGTLGSALGLDEGNNTANVLMDSLVDKNMDWICIKLHCRDSATLGGSKFMLNAIQNIEFAVAPESDMATFQTINKHDPKTAKVADAMNNNPTVIEARRK